MKNLVLYSWVEISFCVSIPPPGISCLETSLGKWEKDEINLEFLANCSSDRISYLILLFFSWIHLRIMSSTKMCPYLEGLALFSRGLVFSSSLSLFTASSEKLSCVPLIPDMAHYFNPSSRSSNPTCGKYVGLSLVSVLLDNHCGPWPGHRGIFR